MDRQDLLLEQADGRYYAIAKVGTGLGTIPKLEVFSKVIVAFGQPSSPGLLLSLAHRSYMRIKTVDPMSLFDQHDQGVWTDDEARLFDFLEDSVAHIVFSFTAIEAFANEVIPKGFTYSKGEKVLGKAAIGRGVGLGEKLDQVLPQALRCASPKDTDLWNKFEQIKSMRHRVIHIKSIDQEPSGPEIESIWGIMLRNHGEPYCDHAHALMGHYAEAVKNRRWYSKYPYTRA